MIADVDEGLRALVRREVTDGADIELAFDAPTRDWGARRNTPTLDFYLYDIREDLRARSYGSVDVKGADGFTVGRHRPPRFFKLSYLVTAWTQRPEDEHRLLSAVLIGLLRHPAIPEELLSGQIAGDGGPVQLSVAIPPPDERSISDVWSALGGELKPSLNVVCLVPVDVAGLAATAKPVLEQPRFLFESDDGTTAGGGIRRHRGRPASAEDALAAEDHTIDERVAVGKDGSGRSFRFQTMPGADDR